MTDPRSDLPDDLRRVLQRAPAARSARDADDLLARVHVGARRRRTRRAVAVGAVGLAAAATVFAVASPMGDRNADAPIAAPTSEEVDEESTITALPVPEDPGEAVEPTGVRVRSIGASSIEEYWVLADASCPTGECSVIGRTKNAAATPLEFSTAPGLTGADAKVRIAGTGEDGWVVRTGQLFATHDAATSWRTVRVPMETVDDVVTSAASVWVTGRARDHASTVVATAAADDDDFREVDMPPELRKTYPLSDTVLTASDQGRLFGYLSPGDPYVEFVAYDEEADSWESYPTSECKDAPSFSATETVLWAICTRAEDSVPMVSTDGGQTWGVVEVGGQIGYEPRIAAIDGERALISTGVELYVLNGDSLDRADPGPEGAGMKTYEEMMFIGETGFILDTDGVLSRSDNGGASWEPVELP